MSFPFFPFRNEMQACILDRSPFTSSSNHRIYISRFISTVKKLYRLAYSKSLQISGTTLHQKYLSIMKCTNPLLEAPTPLHLSSALISYLLVHWLPRPLPMARCCAQISGEGVSGLLLFHQAQEDAPTTIEGFEKGGWYISLLTYTVV